MKKTLLLLAPIALSTAIFFFIVSPSNIQATDTNTDNGWVNVGSCVPNSCGTADGKQRQEKEITRQVCEDMCPDKDEPNHTVHSVEPQCHTEVVTTEHLYVHCSIPEEEIQACPSGTPTPSPSPSATPTPTPSGTPTPTPSSTPTPTPTSNGGSSVKNSEFNYTTNCNSSEVTFNFHATFDGKDSENVLVHFTYNGQTKDARTGADGRTSATFPLADKEETVHVDATDDYRSHTATVQLPGSCPSGQVLGASTTAPSTFAATGNQPSSAELSAFLVSWIGGAAWLFKRALG